MPSTILTSIRTPLKTAIAGVAANTFDVIPETPILPFAAVMPDIPYLEPNLIGSVTRCKINLQIVVGVANMSNEAALDNIEQLIMSILAVIPSGYTVGNISNPNPVLISGTEALAATISVSTQYTQTN